MRVFLAICLLATHLLLVRSNELNPVDPVPWKPPFEPMSARQPLGLAVLLVITNDDPFLAASLDEKQASDNLGGKESRTPNLWCARQIEKAYRRLTESRPDLKNQLSIQGFAAGLPMELTGRETRNVPARAVLALCDPQYRLLGIHIGVPHGDEMISIVEDAEEVAITRQLRAGKESQAKINELTVLRSRERLDRMWTSVLNDLLSDTEREEGEDHDNVVNPIDQARLTLIGETLATVYLADIRRRFGQSDAADQTRLILLEQHFETRQPWCDSLIALIVGEDFSTIWRDVVEMVWRYPPVTADADVEELLSWVKLQLESDVVVLCLEPPGHAKRFPWPPFSDGLSGRARVWQEAHALAQQLPFRTVTAQQLALLIRELPFGPIDIQVPSMARYVFLEPKRDRPMVIRETDSPARFANRLRKQKSKLDHR